ncbi:MAG: transketolase C-terminal domain-containing protein, partial [Rhodospirillales bacterium]
RTQVDPAGSVRVVDAAGDWLGHRDGADATIVACGFALPEAMALATALEARGLRAGVLQRVNVSARDCAPAVAAAARTGRVAIVDDTKSVIRASLHVTAALRRDVPGIRLVEIVRDPWRDELSAPVADSLPIDAAALARAWGLDDAQ